MNERGLVEVPENAVRDEPIAFGLTGVQLGICGIAVLVAAALNLLPIWEPLRIALILVVAGPIAIGAALPIQGDAAVEVEVATAHATIRNELGPIEILIYNGGRRPIAQPATIADAFWYLAHQDRRTWAHELDVRPFKEKF